MSQPSPRYTASERPAKIQEALNTLGSWMLSAVSVEPGWNELVLDIKPLSDTIFVRITESREDGDYPGSVGPLKASSPLIPAVEMLQHACYQEGEGSWFTASIVLTASNWPDPDYQLGASYDRLHEPLDWQGEGSLSRKDLRKHLQTFPRSEQKVPAWAARRLQGRRGSGFDQPQLSQPQREVPEGPINHYLTAALEQFAQAKTEQNLANLARTALGGSLVMDISLSPQAEEGGPISYQVLRLTNGMRALTAYSSAQAARTYSASVLGVEEPRLLAEHAMKVFLQVAHDQTIDVLVLDPGSEQEAFLEKSQIQWLISSPHNLPLQQGLIEENMHKVLLALTAPASTLLVGVQADDPLGRPVMLKGEEEGQEATSLVFTNVAEVAALDPSLQVRSAPALEVLKLLAGGQSQAIRINALTPHATLPMEQVRQLLSVVESQ